uniref:Uncharacterized protein n=1 Tax=Aegilops tauschii subsp. strangulata TaxID=200361 RepID=A0A453MSE1_AEGTS
RTPAVKAEEDDDMEASEELPLNSTLDGDAKEVDEELPPPSTAENGVDKGNEEMPPQDSAEEKDAQGGTQNLRPARKRKWDPVADPSSLEPRPARVRKTLNPPVVDDSPKVKAEVQAKVKAKVQAKNTKRSDGTSTMCHQCQRRDKGRVVQCLGCKDKDYTRRYCMKCIDRWF